MKAIWSLIRNIGIFFLVFFLLRWYIKGHFGKYAIFFWLYSIFCFIMYVHNVNNKPKEDNTPGYVYWERNVKSW